MTDDLLEGMRAADPLARTLVNFFTSRDPDILDDAAQLVSDVAADPDRVGLVILGLGAVAALGLHEAAQQIDVTPLEVLDALMLRAEVDCAPGPDRPDDDIDQWLEGPKS